MYKQGKKDFEKKIMKSFNKSFFSTNNFKIWLIVILSSIINFIKYYRMHMHSVRLALWGHAPGGAPATQPPLPLVRHWGRHIVSSILNEIII